MPGEPQDSPTAPNLDRALVMLRMLWFQLLAGAITITITIVVMRLMQGDPVIDPGPLGYVFLAVLPVSLILAYIVAPRVVGRSPASRITSDRARDPHAYPEWEKSTTADAYHWAPVYRALTFTRIAILEGGMILSAVGFMVTGSWVVLAVPVLLGVALLVEMPSRSALEAFAANARARQTEP